MRKFKTISNSTIYTEGAVISVTFKSIIKGEIQECQCTIPLVGHFIEALLNEGLIEEYIPEKIKPKKLKYLKAGDIIVQGYGDNKTGLSWIGRVIKNCDVDFTVMDVCLFNHKPSSFSSLLDFSQGTADAQEWTRMATEEERKTLFNAIVENFKSIVKE